MKRFFYTHPGLSRVLLATPPWILMIGGFVAIFFFPIGEDGELSLVQAALMLTGFALAGLYALVMFVLPPKVISKTVNTLYFHKYGRLYFEHTAALSRVEHQERIEAAAYQRGLRKKDGKDNGDGILIGIYTRKRPIVWKNRHSLEDWKHRVENYYLYSVEKLDLAKWEQIGTELGAHMAEERKRLGAERENTDIVNAACILADTVDPEVAELARAPQSFKVSELLTLRGVRVCAADISKNRWYLPAEKDPSENRSGRSRKLLGRVTFAVGRSVFPYQNNRQYTDAYYKLLDDAMETSLSQKLELQKADRQKAKEEEDAPDPVLAELSEGEVRLVEDMVYCMDRGFGIVTPAYLPAEAEEEQRRVEEEEADGGEDMGDLEDMIAEAAAIEAGALEEAAEEQKPPTILPDYRGPVVVMIPSTALEPRFKFLTKSAKQRICERIREGLLAQGYQSVSFWDTDNNVIT